MEVMESKDQGPPAIVHKFFKAMRKALRSFEFERCTTRTTAKATWSLTVVTERDELDNLWIAECCELPGCMSQGETEEEALQNLTDAIGGVLTSRMQAHLQGDTKTLAETETGRKLAISV